LRQAGAGAAAVQVTCRETASHEMAAVAVVQAGPGRKNENSHAGPTAGGR